MAPPPDFTLLQVTPDLETGGAEQTTIEISAAVTAAGGRSLVASRGGRMEPALAAAGGRLIRLPVHTKNPLRILANGFALARLVRQENVTLLHVRSRAPAFSTAIASRLTGRPWLATYHGLYGGRSPLKHWYNSVMTRGALVIANSEHTREHVIAEHRADPARVIAIPRGVDLQRFDPDRVEPARVAAALAAFGMTDGDHRTRILLAGRLTRWKGQSVLIAAARQLFEAGRQDFVIWLAGDDQGRTGYRDELAAQAADLGDCVRLVGHWDDMPAAYLAADIVCAPSVRPEAFGRTAAEPQAMARPVIASDQGGARETVAPGETGWLIPPGDPDALAAALAAAIDAGPEARARMGAAGRARVRKRYTAEAMCRATLEVYARVLGRPVG